MTLTGLIQCLGDKIHSVEEGLSPALGPVPHLARLITSHTETFDLFSQERPSGNLGFIDSKSHLVELTVAGHDLAIHQSPAILSSNRAGGTTGAGKLLPPDFTTPCNMRSCAKIAASACLSRLEDHTFIRRLDKPGGQYPLRQRHSHLAVHRHRARMRHFRRGGLAAGVEDIQLCPD